jgi:uncharacterized membrane protein YoaK (UPF0700 family)
VRAHARAPRRRARMAPQPHAPRLPTVAPFAPAAIICNFLGVSLVAAPVVRRPWLISSLAAPLLLLCILVCETLTYLGYGSKWLICFPALAMGAQNTLTKEGELGLMTTLLTGNLQRVGLSFAMALHGDEIDWKEVLTIVTCLSVILSTLIGALVGAGIVHYFGDSWTLLPAGIVQFMCITGYARAYAPGCLPCTQQVESSRSEPLLASASASLPPPAGKSSA